MCLQRIEQKAVNIVRLQQRVFSVAELLEEPDSELSIVIKYRNQYSGNAGSHRNGGVADHPFDRRQKIGFTITVSENEFSYRFCCTSPDRIDSFLEDIMPSNSGAP